MAVYLFHLVTFLICIPTISWSCFHYCSQLWRIFPSIYLGPGAIVCHEILRQCRGRLSIPPMVPITLWRNTFSSEHQLGEPSWYLPVFFPLPDSLFRTFPEEEIDLYILSLHVFKNVNIDPKIGVLRQFLGKTKPQSFGESGVNLLKSFISNLYNQ